MPQSSPVNPFDPITAAQWNLVRADAITGIPVVASVTAAKAIAAASNDDKILIPGFGVYRYTTTWTGPYDDEAVIDPTSLAGHWVLEVPAEDAMYAFLLPEFAGRDREIGLLVWSYNDLATKYNDLATKYNDLATRFNAHSHSALNATSNQASAATNAATNADTAITYATEG